MNEKVVAKVGLKVKGGRGVTFVGSGLLLLLLLGSSLTMGGCSSRKATHEAEMEKRLQDESKKEGGKSCFDMIASEKFTPEEIEEGIPLIEKAFNGAIMDEKWRQEELNLWAVSLIIQSVTIVRGDSICMERVNGAYGSEEQKNCVQGLVSPDDTQKADAIRKSFFESWEKVPAQKREDLLKLIRSKGFTGLMTVGSAIHDAQNALVKKYCNEERPSPFSMMGKLPSRKNEAK